MSDIPTLARDTVRTRDEACLRCGNTTTTIHHRQRRREGGHGVENLIALCGSGTTGCHGWAHANPAAARALGYILPTWIKTPAEIPVAATTVRRRADRPIQGHMPPSIWYLPHTDGTRTQIIPALAAELLAAFGLIGRSAG